MKTTGELRKHLASKIKSIVGKEAEAVNSIATLSAQINASIDSEIRAMETHKSHGSKVTEFGKLSLE